MKISENNRNRRDREETARKLTPLPYPDSHYFKMPNAWINLMSEITSTAEIKVLIYILRHTWGFEDKRPVRITYDEFMKGRKRKDGSRMDRGTGLSRVSVQKGLEAALSHGLIEMVEHGDKARPKRAYRLILRDHSGVTNRGVGVKDLDASEVNKIDTNGKESRRRSDKDTYKDPSLSKEREARKRDTPAMSLNGNGKIANSRSNGVAHPPINKAQATESPYGEFVQEAASKLHARLKRHLAPLVQGCRDEKGRLVNSPVLPNKFEHYINEVLKDGVSEARVTAVISYIGKYYKSDPFCPKIRATKDILLKFDRFEDAIKRRQVDGGEIDPRDIQPDSDPVEEERRKVLRKICARAVAIRKRRDDSFDLFTGMLHEVDVEKAVKSLGLEPGKYKLSDVVHSVDDV